jgi:hypothetical protein
MDDRVTRVTAIGQREVTTETAVRVDARAVGKKPTDLHLRERLRAWLLHYRDTRYQGKTVLLAKALGVQPPTLTMIFKHDRDVGLDLLAKIHRSLHVEADVLLDTDPPEIAKSIPRDAASGTASPVGRKH